MLMNADRAFIRVLFSEIVNPYRWWVNQIVPKTYIDVPLSTPIGSGMMLAVFRDVDKLSLRRHIRKDL